MADEKRWWIVRGGVVPLVVRLVVVGALGLLASCDRESGAPDDDAVEAVGEVAGEGEGRREGEGQREGEAAAARTLTWTNDRSRLSGDKLTNFVPFTFQYPADWQVLEDGTADSPNFVKVESMTADRVTIENFAVGWYSGVRADQVAGILEPQFSQSFPNYRRLSEETHQVDGFTSPGFTFEVTVDVPTGPATFWAARSPCRRPRTAGSSS
jgi:hypothetical protein